MVFVSGRAGSRYTSPCGDEMDMKGLVGGQLHLLSLLIPRRVESKRHDGEETFEVLKRLDEPATPLSLEMELKSELAESRFMTTMCLKIGKPWASLKKHKVNRTYDDCMMIKHRIGVPNFQTNPPRVFHQGFAFFSKL